MISFGCLDLYLDCFWGTYPKRIAMNLKENLAIYSAPLLLLLVRLLVPLTLSSASTNLVSLFDAYDFYGDADEQMTRDEIEYMLAKSEDNTLEAEEIEMLQGFSLLMN